jgi:hypothetical protein
VSDLEVDALTNVVAELKIAVCLISLHHCYVLALQLNIT